MNVVFQCLLRSIGIKEYFFYNLHQKEGKLVRNLAGTVSEKFGEFIKVYYGFNDRVLDPVELRKELGSKSRAFSSNTQEDAHEFFMFLVDQMGKDLTRVEPFSPKTPSATKEEEKEKEAFEEEVSKMPPEEQSCVQWALDQRHNCSIFGDVFTGQYVSKLKCKSCSFVSLSYQSFNMLEVPVPVRQEASLMDCFEVFSKQELLEDNIWKCPKCKKKVQAFKTIQIRILPPVLVVCLKRFEMQSGVASKNNCLVKTNLEGEDLSRILERDSNGVKEPALYKPFAFVVDSIYGSTTAGASTLDTTLAVSGETWIWRLNLSGSLLMTIFLKKYRRRN